MTTTKRHAPPLDALLRELRSQAELKPGDDRAITLSHGARVAWRVRGGVVTFAVSRPGVRVGDRELIVFKAAAGVPVEAVRVPVEAVRVPSEGQKPIQSADGMTHFQVGWRWRC